RGGLPAAVRRAVAVPVQDGFRRGRIYFAAAQRREGAFQLSRDCLGNEVQDGRGGAGAGQIDSGDAALGGRSAEALALPGVRTKSDAEARRHRGTRGEKTF